MKKTRAEYLREWRAESPERVKAYAEARRIPPSQLACSECGTSFEGRKDRLICSRRCKDARYSRQRPETWRAKRRRYQARRRERLGKNVLAPHQITDAQELWAGPLNHNGPIGNLFLKLYTAPNSRSVHSGQ